MLLYDLAMADDRRFSPYCWRARMALWHKGLEFDTQPTHFTAISSIADGKRQKIPVLDHDGVVVEDSFEIALYLDKTFPGRPSLFKGDGSIALTRFIEAWAFDLLAGKMIGNYVKDIHGQLAPVDQAYFRKSREARFGGKLEDIQSGREANVAAFRAGLKPLAAMLEQQPFLGGDGPLFADYIVFATLHSQCVVTAFEMLPERGDLVRDWVERCRDLFDGAPRTMPVAV